MRAKFKKGQAIVIHTINPESLYGLTGKIVTSRPPDRNDTEREYTVEITSTLRFLESELTKGKETT